MNVVFVFNEFALHNHIVERYHAARPGDRISIVKVPLVIRGKSRSATASRILPKLSKRFIWGKLKESVVVSAITLLPKMLGRGAVFRRLRRIAGTLGIPFHRSHDVMSPETLAFIAAQNPDVVVTHFHQIVRKALITVPRLGVVNVHPGVLPEFRGIQPYFWELMEGFGTGGTTLHLIEDESIDTGRILSQARFPLTPGMSVQLNYYLTALATARILPETLAHLERGELEPIPQEDSKGNYYKWPDPDSVDRLLARGHPIVSMRDLAKILTGSYDAFEPADITMHTKAVNSRS